MSGDTEVVRSCRSQDSGRLGQAPGGLQPSASLISAGPAPQFPSLSEGKEGKSSEGEDCIDIRLADEHGLLHALHHRSLLLGFAFGVLARGPLRRPAVAAQQAMDLEKQLGRALRLVTKSLADHDHHVINARPMGYAGSASSPYIDITADDAALLRLTDRFYNEPWTTKQLAAHLLEKWAIGPCSPSRIRSFVYRHVKPMAAAHPEVVDPALLTMSAALGRGRGHLLNRNVQFEQAVRLVREGGYRVKTAGKGPAAGWSKADPRHPADKAIDIVYPGSALSEEERQQLKKFLQGCCAVEPEPSWVERIGWLHAIIDEADDGEEKEVKFDRPFDKEKDGIRLIGVQCQRQQAFKCAHCVCIPRGTAFTLAQHFGRRHRQKSK